jgi:hypothetical protein
MAFHLLFYREQEFSIEIPDAEADEIKTVQQGEVIPICVNDTKLGLSYSAMLLFQPSTTLQRLQKVSVWLHLNLVTVLMNPTPSSLRHVLAPKR